MANVTVTTNTNYDSATCQPLLNGETLTINNGAKVVLDSDPQWGLNLAYLGNVTINDGIFEIDGTKTRLLQYSGGSGTLASVGTFITGQTSGAIGEVIFRTTGSTVTSGTYKFRSVTKPFINGETIIGSGHTATAVGTDTTGWLLIVGGETLTISTNANGRLNIKGDWYELGTSNGLSGQTFQHYTSDLLPAIWVETFSGSNQYEIWDNVTTVGFTAFTNTILGKVFRQFNNNPTITFGDNIQGAIPANGCKIRVPNIHVVSTTAAQWSASTQNRTISATIGNWYDLTTTNTGIVDIDKCLGSAFYLSLTQPFFFSIKNTGVLQAIDISENYSPSYILDSCVAPFSGNSDQALTLSVCNDITITGSTFVTNNIGANTGAISYLNSNNLTFRNNIYKLLTRATTTTPVVRVQQCNNIISDNEYLMRDRLLLLTCNNVIYTNLFQSDTYIPIINTSNAINGIELGSGCNNVKFNGFNIISGGTPVRNNLFSIDVSDTIKIRNIGTPTTPINFLGTTATILNGINNINNLELQRVYANNLRTNFFTLNNAVKQVKIYNCLTNSAFTYTFNSVNTDIRSLSSTLNTPISSSLAAVFGNHYYTYFTGNTGFVGLVFTPKTTNTFSNSQYRIISGNPKFNAGSLLLQQLNDEIEFETPYFIKGFTGLTNNFIVAGTNTANHTITYDINNGTGYTGTFRSGNTLSTNSITPNNGFKIKIRIKCIVTNTTNSLTDVRIIGGSNRTSIDNNLYDLDVTTPTLTLTNVQPTSEIRIYRKSDYQELAGTENLSGTTFSYQYEYTQPVTVDIIILALEYQYLKIEDYVLNSTNTTLPIQQLFDRYYQNT